VNSIRPPVPIRRRTFIRVLAWNAALLGVGFLAVEAAFGGWLDSVRDPAFWRLSIYRNVEWTFSAAENYGRIEPVVYRRDRFGLRGDYGAPENVNILVLGGSTTDERYISEGETWTDTLERCLSGVGRSGRVANAGVAGQSTRGHIHNFEVWLNHVPGLKPRYVIAYIGLNERLLDDRRFEDDAERFRETTRSRWLERLKLNSALYALYRAASGNWTAWRAGIHHARAQATGHGETAAQAIDRQWRANDGALALVSDEHARRLGTANTELRDEISAYAKRLADLANAIRRFGAEPIFVTQTEAAFRLKDGAVRGDLDRYFALRAFNDTVMSHCARDGMRCVDLGREFVAADGDFYDVVHMTPQGSRKAGELVCRALLVDPALAAKTAAPAR
jgi:hypothetical protein